MFLDVVYNHLGPDGNYLAEFGPYFTDTATTAWGPAVNLDGPGSDFVAGSCSTTPSSGSRATGSTACAWTPCRPCTTAARCTSWRSCRPGSTPPGRARWWSPRATCTSLCWSPPTGSTPCGPTTSTTPCTSPSPARAPAGTRASRTPGRWPRRSRPAGCSPASTTRTWTAATAATRPGWAGSGSWSAPRTTTRSATALRRPAGRPGRPRPGRRGQRAGGLLAVPAPAVPGPGVGRDPPVPVLHRPRAGAGRVGPAGPAGRVRRLRLGRPGARPQRPGHLRAVQAGLGPGRRGDPGAVADAAGAAPRGPGARQLPARPDHRPGRPGAAAGRARAGRPVGVAGGGRGQPGRKVPATPVRPR